MVGVAEVNDPQSFSVAVDRDPEAERVTTLLSSLVEDEGVV